MYALLVGAQNKSDDTLKIKLTSFRIWIFPGKEAAKTDSIKKSRSAKKKFTHWGGIDFGVSMLTTIDNKLRLPNHLDTLQMNYFLDLNYGKSCFFSLNFFEKNIGVYKNYINLVTGLGIEWVSYNFKKNITLNPAAPYISASTIKIAPDDEKFSKNKLCVTSSSNHFQNDSWDLIQEETLNFLNNLWEHGEIKPKKKIYATKKDLL